MMIVDFEKIRSDVLAELENEFPPEEQRTGAEKLAHAYDPQIVLVCCKVLMKYHEALGLNVQQQPQPTDEH